MHIILSAAMSVDGFIDDNRLERLLLSGDEDFATVDALRDSCDAILVGAETIRRDNPSLSPRSEAQRQRRLAMGQAADPLKITVTRSGILSPEARFFTDGNGEKLVYTAHANPAWRATIAPLASLNVIAADLERRGIRRLLVEGGTQILTDFLQHRLANELRLAIAPFFVGDVSAPRFVGPGKFINNAANRMRLIKVEVAGDMAVLHYALEKTR